jgi:hypothetical protein
MGKIGRNDPCPCGSGKKYKKCCLEKDEEEARRMLAAAAVDDDDDDDDDDDEAGVDKELEYAQAFMHQMRKDEKKRASPERKRWIRFWEEIEEAPVDEKIERAGELIESYPEFKGELAFSLMDILRKPLQKSGRAKDLDKLIRRVEELHPEAYAEEVAWMNYLLAENAMLEPGGDLQTPLSEMARDPEQGIDEFMKIIYRLQYHDCTDELRRILPTAWPRIKDSSQIMQFAVQEFQDMCFCLVLDKYLEHDPEFDPEDPAFLEEAIPYFEEDTDRLKKVVMHSSGRAKKRLQAGEVQDAESERCDYIFFLSLEFTCFLRRKKGWSLQRSWIAQDQICEYFFGMPPRSNDPEDNPHLKHVPRLLPGPDYLEKFLAGLLNAIGSRPYQAAAFCQAIPPWLEFLTERALADPADTEPIWADIRKMLKPLPKALEWHVYDPVMLDDVKSCL